MLTKRRIYEFDEFRVDTGQFLLSRAGRARSISPTVFKILLSLLERAGEAVTKEELMKCVWPDSFVEEGNLNRNVSTLRKVLEEKPSDHRYIETIPKTGYRFVAPIRVINYQPPTGTARTVSNTREYQIVGREFERDTLSQAYDQAQQGRGDVVCISGDVGVGKTALIDAFLDDLKRDGQTFHLARGRCSESFTEGEPFMPWIESLSALAQEPTISTVMAKSAPSWHREISHNGSGVPRRMHRELLEFCRAAGIRSNVVVPMVRGDESIGLIVVNRREPHVTTPEETRLLQSFASQAVIAIENVRLFNETKEALERQTATSEILKVISASPTDVQPVF